MEFKWVIKQDGETGVCLILKLGAHSAPVWYYDGPNFEAAQKAAFQDLEKIQKAPLRKEREQ